MCLKIENCCLKIFVKIRVGEKVCRNTWNVVQKLKMVVWKYKPNTPFITLSLSEKTPSDTAIGRKGRRKKNLAISSHQTLQGEKETLRHTGDSFGWPLPSPFEFFKYVLLSLPLFLSMSFCCFDLVLKLPYDFRISFPYFREFAEYPRSFLRLKSSRVLL